MPPSRQAAALDTLADHEAARAGRTQQAFVAGKGQQVDQVGLDVDRHDAGALPGVDQQQAAALAGDASDRRRPAGSCR